MLQAHLLVYNVLRRQPLPCRLINPNWPMIAIAPEGMTTNGKQLLHFRSGAFIHSAPVLPVCISYSWKRLNPAWTIGNEPWHIVRMLTQFVNFANVDIMPAYTPNAEEAAHPTTFAANVRQSMVRLQEVASMGAALLLQWSGRNSGPSALLKVLITKASGRIPCSALRLLHAVSSLDWTLVCRVSNCAFP
jgi:hypothetical protein